MIIKIFRLLYAITPLLLIFTITSCSEEYLEKKPDKSLVIPTTLDDFELLLENYTVFNYQPGLGVIGADNYFLTENAWLSLFTSTERNAYIWAKDVYEGDTPGDWSTPYQQIFYANVILDGLEDYTPEEGEADKRDRIKGSALFYRANAFFQLSQLFAPPYSDLTQNEPGIPIRLSSDINAPVTRSSLQESYDQIILDLSEAVDLLPEISAIKSRPDQLMVYALLARVYLNLGDYENALRYADLCLGMYDFLMDYNDLDLSMRRPVPQFNKEVIFESYMTSYSLFRSAYIDTLLYESYADDDLRKEVFFNASVDGGYLFEGTYTGGISLFAGMATDEIYLIRAECYARTGKTTEAMNDLNTLLEKRWKTGTFSPLQANDETEALDIILAERRKELVFRGLRWSDLRRLNREDRYAKVLMRELDGVFYVLPPNDQKYTYPIPDQEVQLSGISQNIR